MFRNRFDVFARFDADGMPQGGHDDTESAGSGDRQGPNPAAAFQRRLREHDNNAMEFASKLFDENYRYRDRARQLQQEIDALKAKALSDDDLQAFEVYKTLGTPDEVKQGLEQKAELQGQLQQKERETVLRQVAEQAGFKPGVLAQLDRMAKAQGKDLAFELREVEEDGRTVQKPFVKDGETEAELAAYATQEWSDFLPALSAQATTPAAPATPPGVRYPVQHPGGTPGAPAKSVADQFLEEQKAKAGAVKNPLLTG